VTELSYAKLVEDSWGDATTIHNLSQLQSALGWMWVSFQEWEDSAFGSVRRDLQRLHWELEAVRRRSLFTGPSHEERRLMARISELLAREETMEKQRSWITWLKEGDRNTTLF
jgi:hypothetical protein